MKGTNPGEAEKPNPFAGYKLVPINATTGEEAEPLQPSVSVLVPKKGDDDSKEVPDFNATYRPMESQTTLAKGLLNITLLAANASQMKFVMTLGDKLKFFYPLIVLISLSIIIQLTVAMILLMLRMYNTDEIFHAKDEVKRRRMVKLNMAITGLVFWVMAINVFITGFGMGMISPGKGLTEEMVFPGRGSGFNGTQNGTSTETSYNGTFSNSNNETIVKFEE